MSMFWWAHRENLYLPGVLTTSYHGQMEPTQDIINVIFSGTYTVTKLLMWSLYFNNKFYYITQPLTALNDSSSQVINASCGIA
ncbi:MAG: hypothetical protein IPP71_19460 [Bacteroidetes bacterium]|nr:hypothetical protein [Bacteroidota bacterium]